MGIGALLIFLGVALFSARVARPLAALVSPIDWGVVVLAVCSGRSSRCRSGFCARRLGARRPWRRVVATILGTVLNLGLALIVLAMWLRSTATSWAPEWPVDFPSIVPDRTANAIGARQHEAQPAANRLDGGRADDRARARHARGRARDGDHGHVRERRQRHLHLRLRDHSAEQLLADSDQCRECRSEGTGRRDDRERPRWGSAHLRFGRGGHGGRSSDRARADAEMEGGIAGRARLARSRRRLRRRRLCE